jgi:CO/xanthine dehydrogenase Mo-binding subunit
MSLQWIGKPINRVGGVERATGAQKYIGDLRLDNMLHARLVRLDIGRARIDRIDTRAARRVKGVRAIFSAGDLPVPMPRFGPSAADQPLLAVGETKFHGEPVAIVVADDEDAAEEAAALVKVKYTELPGVYTIDAALDPASALVQDPALRSANQYARSNIMKEWHFGWGNVNQVVPQQVVENTYTFPMISHFAIEPFTFLAAPLKDGVEVYSAIQHPFGLQRIIAKALSLPVAKVRIIAPDPGGGFGGKGYPKHEPLLAWTAMQMGRPVRLALSLEESFQVARRAACQVHVRTGFTTEGYLLFQDLEANFLVGAYTDITERVISKSSYIATGAYSIPNVRIVARGLFSHTAPSTAFRGFGVPQLNWAIESQMNEAARLLGIDAVELRRRNIPKKDEVIVLNDTPADGNWVESLDKTAKAIHWGAPLPPNNGRGIAMGIKPSATTANSNTFVRLLHDGSALVFSGTSDMGQGARTIFSQIVSEQLSIPLEKVTIYSGDTAQVPFDVSTSASRSTVFMGNAVLKACADIRSKLVNMACEHFGMPPEQVKVDGGCVCVAGMRLSFADLIREYYGPTRGEVLGYGETRGKYIPSHPLGGKVSFWEVIAVGVEVEVDTATGYVTVKKIVNSSDVGKALNPKQVETQDEGATVMGLGHTFMEHLILDSHGRILNLGALDYRIPTIQDIPFDIESYLIENQDGPGPYGSKGVSESGVIAISPAISAAVYEACGVAIRDLPLTPERVWRALQG